MIDPQRLRKLAYKVELRCDKEDAQLCRAAADEIERLRGGVADLQRHVKIACDERRWLPPGLLCVIGAMSKGGV